MEHKKTTKTPEQEEKKLEIIFFFFFCSSSSSSSLLLLVVRHSTGSSMFVPLAIRESTHCRKLHTTLAQVTRTIAQKTHYSAPNLAPKRTDTGTFQCRNSSVFATDCSQY